ncbi:hypothetical protein WJX84_011101 [Apatococcus fuscideae]|uniref:Uncharacterized protein n=1 Tax=Apatococcus fuscideae TaxID=2026836 RepID=A0AAW1SLA1_9CHLO
MDDRVKLHMQLLSFGITAGLIGGVINFLVAPLFAELHILSLFGVNISPTFSKAGLYHNGFWGALWGVAFMVPWHKYFGSWSLRAFIIGLLPAAVQLFLIFPLSGAGFGGISLGICMPLFVILFNTIFFSFPGYAWFTLTGLDSDATPEWMAL